MAIVLGVDPGLHITGYGIVSHSGYQLTYLGSGCINKKINNPLSQLNMIYKEISEIIIQFQPSYFAIEKVFMAKNANTAIKLGEARGVAIVAAVNQGLPIFEYAARQVKQAIVGIGSAKKKQIQYMVRTLLKLSCYPQVDAADALAIAITHCHISNNKYNINY